MLSPNSLVKCHHHSQKPKKLLPKTLGFIKKTWKMLILSKISKIMNKNWSDIQLCRPKFWKLDLILPSVLPLCLRLKVFPRKNKKWQNNGFWKSLEQKLVKYPTLQTKIPKIKHRKMNKWLKMSNNITTFDQKMGVYEWIFAF